MKGLIIILGAPVSTNGEISVMGKGRLDLGFKKLIALKLKEPNKYWKILLTGGTAEHFNLTNRPYAEFAQEYLITSKNAQQSDFVEFALSVNTVDDARQSLPIVQKYSPQKIIVVSSDFHIGNNVEDGRVRLIFDRFFQDEKVKIDYLGANYLSLLSFEEQQTLLAHEAKEIQSLKERGVSIVAGEIGIPALKALIRPIV